MAKINKGVPKPVTLETIEDLINYEGVLPSTLTENKSYYTTLRESRDFKPLGKHDEGLMRSTPSQEYFRGESQKGWGLLPTAVGRLITSTIAKTLEGISTIPSGFQENPLSKEIQSAERYVLDEWFPVYRTEGADSDSLLQRLREPSWWSSTATDGFAFMLSAIIGAKGINAISKIPKVARLAKTLGASDDILMQIDKAQRSAIGKLLALDKPGIAFSTGYNAFNEAGFEARGVFESVKNELAREYGGEFEYLTPEQQSEILKRAGEAARQTFWYNVPMLLLSERIFNETILGNFFGLPESSALKRIVKNDINVKLSELTKYQRAALLGLPFAANIPTEAFQENYQLAVENYFTNRAKTGDVLSLFDFENVSGILKNMAENFQTIEGKESMFLGALLGGLGGVAGIGNLSKSEKKAREYVDILNKGIANLNQSGKRFFQTNPDGSIIMKNGVPVVKTKEQFEKDWETVSDNFSRYQMSTTLQVLQELGDYDVQDLIDIDRANSFSELAFNFFKLENGRELFEQIIDDYAAKIKKEYGEKFGNKTVSEIANELKKESLKLESLYNLANQYYKLDSHPESLAIQYHSLWKQDLYKNKLKDYINQVKLITKDIGAEQRNFIEDLIEKPTDNKIKQLDKVISTIDFKNVDAVTTALDLQNKIAKSISYDSLYKAERQHFEKELSEEDFYEKLKEKIEREKKDIEAEKAKSAETEERKAKIEAEKLKRDRVQQPVAPPENKRETEKTEKTEKIDENNFQKEKDVTSNLQSEKDRLKTQIVNLLSSKTSALATTVARELGIENAKELLEELVSEKRLEKTSNGRYKAKTTEKEISENDKVSSPKEDTSEENTQDLEEQEVTPELPVNVYTPKEAEKQHEEVLKTSENYTLASESLFEGHNVVAMRVVKMQKVFEGETVIRQNKNDFELDEEGNTAYMHSSVKKGDKIIIRPVSDARNVKQYADNKNDKTITFGEKIDNAPPDTYYETVVDNLPLEIVHGNTVIGYVHTVDWINPSNLIENPEFMSLEEQKEALRTFREQFVNPDGSIKSIEVESEILFKSEGKLAKASTEMSVSEAVPNFPIAYAVSNNKVKTFDGKVIETSHKVKPGSLGIVSGNKFFVARRKALTDEHKQMLKEELEKSNKDLDKISSMVYVSNAADSAKALIAARKQKNPNRYKLVVSKNNYWVYDSQEGKLFSENTNLDLYLNQPLIANISTKNTEFNRQWISEMLTTNIREVKANYDGNVEPVIFVHPVIKFDMKVQQKEKSLQKSESDILDLPSELEEFIKNNSDFPGIVVTDDARKLMDICNRI